MTNLKIHNPDGDAPKTIPIEPASTTLILDLHAQALNAIVPTTRELMEDARYAQINDPAL